MNNPENLPLDIVEQRSWLQEHKAATGMSWSEMASKTGIPAGTLSQFGAGSYAGDNLRIAQAVYRYRQLLISQAAIAVDIPDRPPFFETSTTRRIITMLSIAQRGRMVVIAGAPGTSKTETAIHYRESVSNVWIATMKPSSSGINPMQQRVLAALGQPDAKGTPQALTTQIEAALLKSVGLLIIDEAQHLSEKSLEEIRSWHDATGIGIALVGNEEVLTRLTLGSKRDAFARLASRIAQRLIFRGPSEQDALALADAWDLEGAAERAFVVDKSKRPGGLRTCTMLMEIAAMLAAADKSQVRVEHLRDAWADLATTGQSS
ncbi:MAG: AAA family ATPase [Pseudomonadota bacterium]